jgi:hypothetical protein
MRDRWDRKEKFDCTVVKIYTLSTLDDCTGTIAENLDWTVAVAVTVLCRSINESAAHGLIEEDQERGHVPVEDLKETLFRRLQESPAFHNGEVETMPATPVHPTAKHTQLINRTVD